MRTITLTAICTLLGLAMAGCACCGICRPGDAAECKQCGTPQCKCAAATAKLPTISTAALRAIIDAGTPVTLVDARTGKYDDGRRLPGALNLGPEADSQAIQSSLANKGALIVTYCANPQCPASGKLAARLRELGYRNILEYTAGIEGWVAAGNKVTTVAK